MRKRKNEIFTTIKEDIVNHAKAYFIVVIIFTVGVFLGVLFVNQKESKEDIEKYIHSYIDETKQIQNGNYFEELQKDIKSKIGLTILLWFAGTTIVGMPIVLGIILFRGFCLGYTIASCIFTLGKVKGIIFVLITIFLQNAIFIPAIMILGVSSIKLYTSIVKDRRRENIKLQIFKHTIFSLLILTILICSSLVETYISGNLSQMLIKYC